MKLHPRAWSRRSIATILALGLLLGGAVAAAAITGGGGESNAVVVVNTKDGTSESKAGVKVAHDATDSVDNGNAAVAESSCTNCRSVAVAAQVVLVERNANVVTPTNIAMAMNVNCTGCQTMAAAYQDVVSTDGIVHFSAQGETEMNDIRHRIEDLIDSPSVSLWDLKAQLDAQVQQLWDVVDTELVHSGQSFSAAPHKKVEMDVTPADGACASPPAVTAAPAPEATGCVAGADASPSASSTPAPAASPTPCPTDTPSPVPSDSATPTPTPTVSPSPSPSPCPTTVGAEPAPGPSSVTSPSPADTASSLLSAGPTESPSPTDSPTPSPSDGGSPSPSP